MEPFLSYKPSKSAEQERELQKEQQERECSVVFIEPFFYAMQQKRETLV